MSTISLRAIPSTIAQKSTPTIPPASQVFEPYAKSVLQKRFSKDVLINAAIIGWLQAIVAVGWSNSGEESFGFTDLITVPISPSVLVVAAGLWAVGSLPVVVSRKIAMSGM
jgi:nucleoporin NDC1